MLVSLLIPCRNATDWLPAFLPRLASLHQFTYPSFPEIVFIDDASTDGTTRLLFHWAESAFLPVKVLGLDTVSGRGVCLREGIALAQGDAVALCLGFDTPLESALAPLIARIDAGADVATIDGPRSWRIRGLAALLRFRHGLTPEAIALMMSRLSVWKRDALLESLPSEDGLSAMIEAGLQSVAHGHVHSVIDDVSGPRLAWQTNDWRAVKWLGKRPRPH